MPAPLAPHAPHGGHRWILNFSGSVDQAQASVLFAKLASQIAESGVVEFRGGEQVVLPGDMTCVLRHEILPKGELVLKVELMWAGQDATTSRPISDLLG